MQHVDKRLQTLEAELDGLDIEDVRIAQTKAKGCFHRLRDEQEEKNKALIARLEGAETKFRNQTNETVAQCARAELKLEEKANASIKALHSIRAEQEKCAII